MKSRTRIIGLVALALLVVGALGYAVSDGSSGGQPPVALQEDDPAANDLMLSIDQALGRNSAVAPQSAELRAAPPVGAADAAKGAPSQAGSGGATTTTAPGSAPDSLGQIADRKIVETASVRMQVKDVGGSFSDVGRIAAAAGGFVASSSFSYQGEQQVANVTIRVPASKYQDVLAQVRDLGAKVDSEASNASDVTEEYTDLGARLRTLEATEQQLIQFLGQAKNVGEVLQIQDRLNAVRTEIERVKGRMGLLDRLSDMATITVQLRPVVVAAKTTTSGGHNLGEAVSDAWESSVDFLAGIAAGVLTVVVFSWWILPLALPALWVLDRWLRARPPTATTAATYD